MLGRYYNGIYPFGDAGDIFHRYLGFAVRPQKIENFILSCISKPLGKFVGIHNRHRHQFRGFIGCVSEHNTLITRSLILEQSLAGIYSLGNIR